MPEEPIITMTEFRTVVEEFKSEQKRMSEYLLHLDQKMNNGFSKITEEFQGVDRRFIEVGAGIHSLNEQIGLLHEGQTEIKLSLKQKVDRDEFAGL